MFMLKHWDLASANNSFRRDIRVIVFHLIIIIIFPCNRCMRFCVRLLFVWMQEGETIPDGSPLRQTTTASQKYFAPCRRNTLKFSFKMPLMT